MGGEQKVILRKQRSVIHYSATTESLPAHSLFASLVSKQREKRVKEYWPSAVYKIVKGLELVPDSQIQNPKLTEEGMLVEYLLCVRLLA